MDLVKPDILEKLWFDFDARETLLRQVITERLAANR